MEKVNLTLRKDRSNDNFGDASKGRQNISFKFSKQVSKKLSGNTLNDEENRKLADRELILSVEDKEIKSTALRLEKKKELIIHPVHKNVWRKPVAEGSVRNSLEQLAVKELLQESAIENEKWEKREFSNITVTIPMVMQNKVPEGYETDEKLDVRLRAEESNLDDYENIPVEDYGAALLRGLGCNPGDPIGNKNQTAVAPIEAVVRSKGLGLGAGIKPQKKKSSKEGENEILDIVCGAYVRVLQGFHEGHYGEVEGLDESRAVIKLSSKQSKVISLPLLYVEPVSKKEFKKESKVLNRTAYNEYNKEQGSRNGYDSYHGSRQGDYSNENSHYEPSSSERHRESGHSSKRSSHNEDDSSSRKSHKKRKHSPEKSSKQDSSRDRQVENWVCPLLRVRFVNDRYRKGKFFNQKMIVEDVVSSKCCICKTEDGKYIEDISPDMLETVVPRSDSSYVMVVQGKYKRQLGVILKRDKANCLATIHFLSDRSKVIEIEYDSICEYVGDVSQYD